MSELTSHCACIISVQFLNIMSSADNSLNPDQVQQNVGPDQDPKCLTLMVFLTEFLEHAKLTSRQRVKQ